MHRRLLILFGLCLFLNVAVSVFPNVYRTIKQLEIVGDPGEPLLLTPLIQQDQIEEARAAAEVDSNLFLGVRSYAVVQLIQQGKFLEANRKDYTKLPGAPFSTKTGFTNLYNYLYTIDPTDVHDMDEFVQLSSTLLAIHSPWVPLPWKTGPIYKNLEADIMQSVAPWVSELPSNVRVMFYNGQLDIIVAYPLTDSFLQNLEFDAAEKYRTASRRVWRVDNDVAGYFFKGILNIWCPLINLSGLIYRFTRNQIKDL